LPQEDDMRKITTALIILIFCFWTAGTLYSQQNEEDQKFLKYLDGYFDALWKFYPTMGTLQGYHKYDNKLEDLKSGNIEKRHEELDRLNQELVAKIDSTKLSPEFQIDHAMMVDGLDRELMKHENLIPWEYNPIFYNSIFNNCVRSLLTKEFAPAEERAKNATDRLKNLPKLIKQAKEHLKTPPQIYTETAIAQFAAILNFYKNELPQLIDQAPASQKPKLQQELTKVIPELEAYQTFLQSELLPRSTGVFRLAEAHRRLVRGTFQNSIPLNDLVARATADYNNIRREMFLVCIPFYRIMYPNINLEQLTTQRGEEEVKNIAIKGVIDKIKGDHISKDEFMDKIKTSMEEIKSFLLENELLDLPDVNYTLETMPLESHGKQWTKIVPPGIYETSEDYVCYLSPIPETADEQAVTSFLEEFNNFFVPFFTCRNVYPGPFVPYAFTRQNPSMVRKMYPNMPLLKGWSVYVDEMLLYAGYGNYDLRLRLNQLKNRLKTVIDFNLDFNIHEGGMTKEQAIAYMTRGAFLTEAEAELNWNRIILNPGESTYTYVGYQEFLDLELEYKKLKGDAFTRKEFLNKVLSFGALPMRQLKQKLMQ
jgi:uncharacterized protein (DUF885 family)